MEQVRKEIRATVIIEKVYSTTEDEIYVSIEQFMERSLVEHCHDERKL